MAYISKTRWHIAKVTFTRILIEVTGFDVHGFPVAFHCIFIMRLLVYALLCEKVNYSSSILRNHIHRSNNRPTVSIM